MLRRRERVLRATRPNCGLEAMYRRRLRALVDELSDSVEYWVRAAYRASEPVVAELARDELSASALRDALRRLARRWTRRIEETAERLAEWFAQAAAARSDAALRRALRDGGFSVEFKLTRAQRDVLRATVEQNVSLIKSIGQRYLSDVEGAVMRSAQTGRDVGALTSELREKYQLTKKRAAFISLDQNQKATSALTRVRRLELGLKEAIWMHSHAGKQPRPAHVKMHGKRFDVAKGMWDPHERKFVQPGELIRCRCTSRSVVPGFA